MARDAAFRACHHSAASEGETTVGTECLGGYSHAQRSFAPWNDPIASAFPIQTERMPTEQVFTGINTNHEFVRGGGQTTRFTLISVGQSVFV